jgi:hypothetical protein
MHHSRATSAGIEIFSVGIAGNFDARKELQFVMKSTQRAIRNDDLHRQQ